MHTRVLKTNRFKLFLLCWVLSFESPLKREQSSGPLKCESIYGYFHFAMSDRTMIDVIYCRFYDLLWFVSQTSRLVCHFRSFIFEKSYFNERTIETWRRQFVRPKLRPSDVTAHTSYPLDPFIKSNICWQNAISNFKHTHAHTNTDPSYQTNKQQKICWNCFAWCSTPCRTCNQSAQLVAIFLCSFRHISLWCQSLLMHTKISMIIVFPLNLSFQHSGYSVHLLKNALDLFALYWVFNLRAF